MVAIPFTNSVSVLLTNIETIEKAKKKIPPIVSHLNFIESPVISVPIPAINRIREVGITFRNEQMKIIFKKDIPITIHKYFRNLSK